MWRFLISAVLMIAVVVGLDVSLKLGSTRLPPLGTFFSPSHGFWNNAETALPEVLTDKSAFLDRDVEVVFDDRLVPHIYAKNERDLFFAQGYVTAMHRLWQMDIATRSTSGRISEILGEGALEYDKGQRTKGLTFAAERTLERWREDTVALEALKAYTAGVNAYVDCLKPRNYPLEFKILDYAPEHWTLLKTALFTESMALTLCSHEYDLEFTNLRNTLGEDLFDYLFPEYNPDQDPIIPPGTSWDFDMIEDPGTIEKGRPAENSKGKSIDSASPGDRGEVGSNNWAISGKKTASGNPILCSDPHLQLTLPSIWYEAELHAPDINCHGVTLCGIPGVIIGFNQNIAWGMTNVGHDVLDWYAIEWADPEENQYYADGNVRDVSLRIEKIAVKGGRIVNDTVKYTIWGPVQKSGPHSGMALRWLAHETGPPGYYDADVFININKANNLDDFLNALDKYHSPAQNFVFADTRGNIAMRIGGALPLRKQGAGKFIITTSQTADSWSGYIPTDHNPVVINPPRGFVSSANQRTTDSTYPYYYAGGAYFEDWRGRHLNMRLTSMEDITPEDCEALQFDSYSLKAAEVMPILMANLKDSVLTDRERSAIAALDQWGFEFEAELEEPTLFELWYNAFYWQVWDELEPLRDTLPIIGPESWRTIQLAREEPDTLVFDITDTDERETLEDVVTMTLQSAVAKFDSLESDKRAWGAYQNTLIDHLAGIPGMGFPVPDASGHGDALNATQWGSGPSWRMVVELANPVVAHVVYPGGQSGNPGSQYYDNMVDDWANSVYHTVRLRPDADQSAALQVLTLKATGS